MNNFPVENAETLARFIFTPYHIKSSDGSVRWQAFKPAHDGTSVTRQDFVSFERVFELGHDIARVSSRNIELRCKAEIQAQYIYSIRLGIKPAPSKRDPNHANIVGWPLDKNARMALCKELRIHSRFIKP